VSCSKIFTLCTVAEVVRFKKARYICIYPLLPPTGGHSALRTESRRRWFLFSAWSDLLLPRRYLRSHLKTIFWAETLHMSCYSPLCQLGWASPCSFRRPRGNIMNRKFVLCSMLCTSQLLPKLRCLRRVVDSVLLTFVLLPLSCWRRRRLVVLSDTMIVRVPHVLTIHSFR
jgi:hypothetical protein